MALQLGLAPGVQLGRPLLRRLRRELTRARGQAVAGRALARRDLSAAELQARLERARLAPGPREELVSGLQAAGVVDDGRAARGRARALAERGWGDAAIEARLEAACLSHEHIRAALAELEPEAERARALAAAERDPTKAARLLARRGFDPELVADLAGGLYSGEPGGLG